MFYSDFRKITVTIFTSNFYIHSKIFQFSLIGNALNTDFRKIIFMIFIFDFYAPLFFITSVTIPKKVGRENRKR